jgi:hypothetical protein
LRYTLDIRYRLREHAASAQDADLQAKDGSSQNAMDLILRGLKAAYGEKLYILYTPAQPFLAESQAERQEQELLAECKARGMRCQSLRERMVEGLLAGHQLARGFPDTTPGTGHLNRHGHEMAADQIDDWLKSSH